MKKKNRKPALSRRILAFLLAFVMVVGYIPAQATAETAAATEKKADTVTLDRFESLYGTDTAHAGKVTVDKSVSTTGITIDDTDDDVANGTSIALTDSDNFLVTVSQAAQVMALSTQMAVPVDVVFVLDTSGSMNNDNRATTMVTAANTAIKQLMQANKDNRISVVAFSSAGYGKGTSNKAAANVLSPLAHYSDNTSTETTSDDEASNHLRWTNENGTSNSGSYLMGRSAGNVTRGIRLGNNTWGGGTNIHAGIALGAQQLSNVAKEDTYIIDAHGNKITRIPFIIVLSDGAPTFGSDSETWYTPDLKSENGNGQDYYTGNGFLAALTAAYYKGKITEHYFGSQASDKNRCFVYTLGVAIQNTTLAELTLNPSDKYNANASNGHAGRFKTYWENYKKGSTFSIATDSDNGADYSVQKATIEATKNYVNGLNSSGVKMYDVTAGNRVGGIEYNDGYYSATQTNQIAAIFNQIVRDIAQKAIAPPTQVTSTEEFSGYVTFTDVIGEYMEVKDMKGVMANGYFYQGANFAQYLTQGGSDEFDATLQAVLKNRLSGTTTSYDALLAAAKDSPNQAYYNGPNDYDNSIVWWGKTYSTSDNFEQHVQFVAPADNDTVAFIEEQKKADETDPDVIPGEGDTEADVVCRSYFFCGEAGGDVAEGEDIHEMMYFIVRVQRSLVAPYQQTVTISAPASLLSKDEVYITEDATGTTLTYTAEVVHNAPARVIYEVGLRSDINAYNIDQIVGKDTSYIGETTVLDGQTVSTNYADGQYYFYTNDWNRAANEGSHERAMSKATFYAANYNSYYTYQENTYLYEKSGDDYLAFTGDPAGKTLYYYRDVYDWDTETNSDGALIATKTQIPVAVTIPGTVAGETNALKQDAESKQWYITPGTYTAAVISESEDVYKGSGNNTDTSDVVAHPVRTGDADDSHYTVYLGNNGKLTMAAEKSKTVYNEENVDIDGELVVVGDELTYQIEAVNHEATAATITITDTIPEGSEYVQNSASNNGVYDAATRTITWTIGNVEPDAKVTVSFKVTVTSAAVDTIDNTASVKIGNNPAYDTNTTVNPPLGKTSSADVSVDGKVQVGSIITYSIYYFNNESDAATVTITDTVPAGTTYVANSASYSGIKHTDSSGSEYDVFTNDDGSLKWVLANVPAGASGTITFQVQVDPSAVNLNDGQDTISNTATIQLGNEPAIKTKTTNTTEDPLSYGDLVLTKEVVAGNAQGDKNKYFTLVLDAGYTGAQGTSKLSGTFTVTGSSKVSSVAFVNGAAKLEIKHDETITVKDLPAGILVEVYEETAAGYTPAYSADDVTIAAASAAQIDVTNTYNVEPINFTLDADKVLTGRTLADGEFSFVVYEFYGDNENQTIVSTGKNKADGTIEFKPITYTAKGEHNYTIVEVASGLNGITYDAGTYAVTVKVTDSGNGQLQATPVYPNDGVKFENKYQAAETSLVLEGTKTLTGNRALKDAEFSFVVTDTDGNVVTTGENKADGTIEFKPITYKVAGTYKYTVSEVNSGLKGIAYSTAKYEVTVVVEDDQQQGSLVVKSVTVDNKSATVTTTDNVAKINTKFAFTNIYQAADTSLVLEGTKTLTGNRALKDAEFSFVVTDTDGNVVTTGENKADGTIEFKPITYKEARTYEYTVSEVSSGLKGITYATATYKVVVTVTDNQQGSLMVTDVKVDNTAATVTTTDNVAKINTKFVFTNTYQAADTSLVLEGTKTLTGRSMVAGEFSFVVTDTGGNVVTTGENKADGTIEFKPITYKEADTYEYTVSEVSSGLNGITYDTDSYTVKVVVADDGKGSLYVKTVTVGETKATVYIQNNVATIDTDFAFQNTYDPGYLITTVPATKILDDKTDAKDQKLTTGAFSFVAVDAGGKVVASGTNDANGNITLGNFTFTLSDMADAKEENGVKTKTFTYTAYELIPTEAKDPYMAYSEARFTVEITVTYKADGTWGTPSYKIKDAEGQEAQAMVFTNTKYNNYVRVTPEATKTTENGGNAAQATTFSFLVEKLVNGEWVQRGTGTAPVSSASVPVNFSQLTITEAGTHYFRIKEANSGTIHGITYDDAVYLMEVVVVYEDNQLKAANPAYYYYDDSKTDYKGTPVEGTPSFQNEYNANGSITLSATKSLEGRDLNAGEFFFNLVGENGTKHTGTMDANGLITFGTLYYSLGDLDEDTTKTFYYVMSEVKGVLPGITYETDSFHVYVTVKNEGSGTLKVYLSDVNGNDLNKDPVNGVVDTGHTFTNSYEAVTGTTITVKANKVLTGRDLIGAEFDFGLYSGEELIDIAENDEDGNIVFTLTYPASVDPQTFAYTLKEINGGLAGVEYDTRAEYALEVTVSEDTDTASLYVSKVTVDGAEIDVDSTGTNYDASAVAVFNNSYDAEDTSVTLEGTKVLAGREMVDNEFSFVVKDQDNKVVSTGLSKKDGSIAFTPIGYTDADRGKTFTYTITEVQGNLAGVTYTSQNYTATVTVKDNTTTGKLEASVQYSGDVVFNNSYDAEDTSVTLEGTKVLTGRAMADNEFSFVVKDQDNKVVSTGLSKADGSIVFTPIGYTDADRGKTFNYTITEVQGNLAGVTYDPKEYKVTVAVKDNTTTGKLEASVRYSGDVVFNNSYKAAEASVTLEGTKVLTGRDMKDNEFSFIVYEYYDPNDNKDPVVVSTGLSKAAKSGENGKIVFTPIGYTAAGEHTYTIVEVKGNLGGVHYTADTFNVTVNVTDNTVAGKLETVVTYPGGGVVFKNTYNVQGTTYTPKATKVLNGRTMTDDEFSFVVKDKDNKVVSTGLSKKDGTIVFTPIGYAAAGTHEYTVSEVKGNLGGVTYSTENYKFTVKVVDDNNGNLVATGENDSNIKFTNTYTAEPVELALRATKNLNGKNLLAEEFSFQLKDSDGNVLQTVKNGKKDDDTVSVDSVTFEAIKYTEPGDYVYTISEAAGTDARYTYDGTIYTAVVTVKDDGAGELYASYRFYLDYGTSGQTEVGAAVFNNSFVPEPIKLDLNDKITFSKSVTSNAGTTEVANGYKFEVYNWNNDLVASGESDASGNIDLEQDLEFKTAGDYRFRVVEVAGTRPGMIYDETVWIVHVTVAYNNDTGELSITDVITHVLSDIDDHSLTTDEVEFINVYDPKPATLTLYAAKNLEGRPLKDHEFTFHLMENNLIIAEGKNHGEVVSFTMTYTEVGEHTYTVHEHKPETALPGMNYDTNTYTVKVKVTDEGGQLVAKVIDGTADLIATFNNSYIPDPVTVPITAQKVLEGGKLTAGKFTFELEDSDGEVADKLNAADGSVTFELTYSHEDMVDETGNRVAEKEFVYELREKKGNVTGMTYDDTIYKVTVKVVDDLNGKLHATVEYSDIPVFTNIYDGKDAFEVVTAQKVLEGRALKEGEFTFELVDESGKVTTATNDAQGNVVFSELQFSSAGTYTYTLREKAGTEANMAYDSKTYKVTITVTADDNGDFSSTLEYETADGKAPVFKNVYTPAAVKLKLEATKVLTGRDMKAEEFKFQIHDSYGNLVGTGSNAADGKIVFTDVTLPMAGQYELTVTEVAQSETYMTYDTTKFQIVVNVSDSDNDGVLTAEVKYPEGGIKFQNTYKEPDPTTAPTEPSKPAAVSPETGDDTPLGLLIGVMVISVIAIAALLLLKKKKGKFSK